MQENKKFVDKIVRFGKEGERGSGIEYNGKTIFVFDISTKSNRYTRRLKKFVDGFKKDLEDAIKKSKNSFETQADDFINKLPDPPKSIDADLTNLAAENVKAELEQKYQEKIENLETLVKNSQNLFINQEINDLKPLSHGAINP